MTGQATGSLVEQKWEHQAAVCSLDRITLCLADMQQKGYELVAVTDFEIQGQPTMKDQSLLVPTQPGKLLFFKRPYHPVATNGEPKSRLVGVG